MQRRWLAVFIGLLLFIEPLAAGNVQSDPGVKNAPAAPNILSRGRWGAKQALRGMQPQQISGIILHHTGVRKNLKLPLATKMLNLQSYSQHANEVSPGHRKPAWPDVPYHFYMDAMGQIAEGRDIDFAGDTNTNYNTLGFIQVVVEGDFETESPSAAQLSAVVQLLIYLTDKWRIPVVRISVHQQHAATDCPGRNLLAALPSVLRQITEKGASSSH